MKLRYCALAVLHRSRGVGVGERENQKKKKKKEGKQEEIGAKRLKGEACERESENETYVFY